ncbi:hypothetical protein HDV06_006673 [Boothiomyces sp. JEL0866]|nr:hypothetical protein HDV06_006673 [Boothiomyces sp. JEL0866]
MIAEYILAIVVAIQIGVTIGMIRFVIVRKTVRSFYRGFLALLIFNELLAITNFCYVIGLIIDRDIEQFSFPFASFLLSFIVLSIVLLDIEVLRIFAILDSKITSLKLKLLAAFSIVCYIALDLLPQILAFFLKFGWSFNYYYYGAQYFGLYAILMDNFIAFYVSYLVYTYKQIQSKQISVALHQNMKKLVLMNLGVMLLDWTTFGLSSYISISLANGITSIVPNWNAYFIISTDISVGIHSLCQVMILNSLKTLSLTEIEEVPSFVPSTVALDR